MQDPPYDRPLALASLVRTMRDHFLDVSCGCGAHRVIGLGLMAKDRRLATATMADIALRLKCEGCVTGPTGVYLTATVNGLGPPAFGPGVVWQSLWSSGRLVDRIIAGIGMYHDGWHQSSDPASR